MTPELWSITLDHRTQILFNLDISTVLFNLEVKNGSKVVESGTGSGSLSTSFARTIAPEGHLYTFEFHEERAKHAVRDFTDNGIDQYITVTHRNVCKDGFKLPEIEGMIGNIDAVFLDLPSPWEAIDHAVAVMREGGMLCSFSPCIEQVQTVCLKLDESDFEEIKTIEVLLRNIDIRIQEDQELFLNNPFQKIESKLKDKDGETSSNEKKTYKRKKWENGKIEPFSIGGISGENYHKLQAKPVTIERGHTGYLTFARYMPKTI
ncbi:tRNA-methyltransferase subunit [Heterostelium album PN500]|uniref:tRNA (adenine(58)-N(1))-methyltransferase n=1 Tax=Heterostelium pallidum (strain ATCC 26659 / Pp 5 / PN500) TaxID=670386 RepID=D3BPL5_HETP5|nr:tRNA-methyltransferase subunit [Heterostelium album PN500]EFA76635.1 tRNA-methyltransferase subunit [Heterostelium album PN500]|eukprot:XP_020428767.1 tRNA-methyltransferase subunit [Heterostelium album PN500]